VNRFELRRYEAGMSLASAAQRSGVGRTTLSRLENGHTESPSAEVVSKLAETYSTTVADLLGLEPAGEAA